MGANLAPTVVSVLPYKDFYADHHYGAVSLCVADFARHSGLQHVVLGKPFDGEPLADGHFIPVHYRRLFFQSETTCYAKACGTVIRSLPSPLLVECHNRPAMISTLQRATQAPVALHFHNDPQQMRGSKTIQERLALLGQCAAIIFNSAYIRQRFFAGLPGDGDVSHLRVQYQGFDFQRYPVVTKTKAKQIVFVGKCIPDKGVLVLAQAACRVLGDYPDWSIVWVVPRSEQSTPYQQQFNACCEQLGAQSKVLGHLPYAGVLQHFAESAVACLPSTWEEPFGRVVMEAMAMGCAVITSRRGGIPEIAGDAACVVDDVNTDTLADALHQMLQDENKRLDFQTRAQQRIQHHFNLPVLTKQLDDWRGRSVIHHFTSSRI